jgi:anaerobic magnesium-protoporphyrin IX monomethyl ester cyclase
VVGMSGEARVALIEAGSPGLNIYSHVAMGRGVPLLATVLRDAGYEVRAYVEDISGKGTIDWEWVRTAAVVGFSTVTCTLPRTRELLERLREVNPGAVVVLGGPESTCHPARSFECGADYVLKGEAELTLPRLLDVITGRSDERSEDIPGLLWRRDGTVGEGPPTHQLTSAELDAIPPVDRTLIHSADALSVAAVWRTRGCPGQCDFCEVREIYPLCVRRSDERTLDELMAAQSDGYATTFLIDDNAAANKPAFVEFLRSIVERGYARMLVIQMRADAAFRSDGRLDRELLRLLKRAAAVTVVCVGVESATDADLEEVQKHTDAKRMARALRAMRHKGLLVHGMFIALKNDTRVAIKKNGDYARRYVTSLQYLFETPLPGTKRTREHEADGSILFTALRDLHLYDGMHVVLRPAQMSAEEMQALVVREYRRFYSTWRVVTAALSGAFLRFRRLDRGQRAYVRQVGGLRRLRRWLQLHIEYKFAPVAFRATGWARLRTMLRDPDYSAFLGRVRNLGIG